MTPKVLTQNETNHFHKSSRQEETNSNISNCSIIMGNMILLTHEELGC